MSFTEVPEVPSRREIDEGELKQRSQVGLPLGGKVTIESLSINRINGTPLRKRFFWADGLREGTLVGEADMLFTLLACFIFSSR